jgi:hypothetical protein
MIAGRIRHTVAFTAHLSRGIARFVQERWLTEVRAFLELDYAAR